MRSGVAEETLAVVGINAHLVAGDAHDVFSASPPAHCTQDRCPRAAEPDVVLAERIARVVDPVVHLELDPGGSQDVQRTRRHGTYSAVEELAADRDRVGRSNSSGAKSGFEIAAEGRADRAHLRRRKIVAAAVKAARRCAHPRIGGGGALRFAAALRAARCR